MVSFPVRQACVVYEMYNAYNAILMTHFHTKTNRLLYTTTHNAK